ncbi:MAG: hypothetical protein V1777_00040 [Candidatus Micrarchaeota archaeon]
MDKKIWVAFVLIAVVVLILGATCGFQLFLQASNDWSAKPAILARDAIFSASINLGVLESRVVYSIIRADVLSNTVGGSNLSIPLKNICLAFDNTMKNDFSFFNTTNNPDLVAMRYIGTGNQVVFLKNMENSFNLCSISHSTAKIVVYCDKNSGNFKSTIENLNLGISQETVYCPLDFPTDSNQTVCFVGIVKA